MSATPVTSLRPPDVIAELINLLQASPINSDQTLIRWGLLPELPTQRERVYLLGVAGYELTPETPSHRVRSEEFAVQGLIEVHQLGDQGPEPAARRAWELLAGLDAALQDDFGLEAGGRYSGSLRVPVDQVSPMSDGWLASLRFLLDLEGWS